jgi:hypothetical protein
MILNGGYQWLCDKISSSKIIMNRCAPPTNQVNMISTNSPVLPLGQIAPPPIQGQFGNLPMVGGVSGLPPPNKQGYHE